MVPEQAAALQALAMIKGREAAMIDLLEDPPSSAWRYLAA
jgi:hypothetical protein